MNYFSTFVIFCTFTHACISSTEIELEPTPLALPTLISKPDQQVRDLCKIYCSDLDSSMAAANSSKIAAASAWTVASSKSSAVSMLSLSAKNFCYSHPNLTTDINVPGVVCPTVRSSEQASAQVKATPAVLEHLGMTPTADAHSSVV